MFIGGGGREAVSGRRRPAPAALGPAARGRSRAQSRSVPSARTPALPLCSGRPAPHSPLPGVRSEARGDGSGAVHGGCSFVPCPHPCQSSTIGSPGAAPSTLLVDSLCWQQFSHALKRQTRSILLCGSIPVPPPARSRSMASR